ncbi:MAG: hypothetical protein GY842_12600 [bacterium]|nr:hypothetical protein [bacterium]
MDICNRGCVVICVFIVGVVACAASPVLADESGAERQAELRSLAVLEGDAYLGERDRLLKSCSTPWDLEAACAESWETGLAAYVLNQRQRVPKEFARITNPKKGGFSAIGLGPVRNTEDGQAGFAYLLELMWKSGDERTIRFAQTDFFAAAVRYGWMPATPPTLWRKLWSSEPDELWRPVVLYGMAVQDDEPTRDLIIDLLLSGDLSGREPGSILLAIGNIERAKPGQGTQVFLRILPMTIERENLVLFQGVAAELAGIRRPEARRALYDVALDREKGTDVFRRVALSKCSSYARDEDIEVFRAFLAAEEDMSSRVGVIGILGRGVSAYTYAQAGPLLRELLETERDPRIIERTVRSLDSVYSNRGEISPEVLSSDLALLAHLAETGSLNANARKYAAKLEAKINWRLEHPPKPKDAASRPDQPGDPVGER